ncbi:MAG TPA: hypothetical protein VL382_01355 [Terriglobales bacterium]|nr:hypothetical protein [Terriglobales bacterium]
MSLGTQIVWLLVLAVPVACLAWTVTHEELFREPREYCQRRSARDRSVWTRKFFYMLTCEYCFSHYVAAAVIAITRFWMLYPGWRGFGVAWLALVWVANIYMGIFGKVKLEVRKERAVIKKIEKDVEKAA